MNLERDDEAPRVMNDLTFTQRAKAILGLALPIIGGMASQNVLNLVDTAMVGQLGDSALAAVGFASFLNFFASAFILGLGAGVQAVAARRLGEDQPVAALAALKGGLMLAVALAVPWSAVTALAAPVYLNWFLDDAAVVEQAVPYLRVRLVTMAAMGCNFAFRGYWSATAKTGLYLRTLVLMHATNIVLNYLFIFGKGGLPALGVTGAGLASALSTLVGLVTYISLASRHAPQPKFLRVFVSKDALRAMLRLSAPAGAQQTFFAGGMTAFMWIASQLGTREVAATHVLTTLLLMGVLPGMGFGLAAATLVGRSLGARQTGAAKVWGIWVAAFAFILVACVTIPAWVAPEWVLRGFISEPETRLMAQAPLRLLGVFLPLDTIGMVFMHAMIGAGDTRRTFMVSSVLQWGLFLPFAYLAGPGLAGGLLALWVVHVGYRQLQSLLFSTMWFRGAWSSVTI